MIRTREHGAGGDRLAARRLAGSRGHLHRANHSRGNEAGGDDDAPADQRREVAHHITSDEFDEVGAEIARALDH